uniref:Tetraspanin n=1 Tax=Timema poppense TaxID=170557 RepID=A0A7R9DML2_TIMPO|nr:unnamed protein product [Timema poppensis]
MGFPSISISKETLRTLINVLISFNLIGSIFSSILIHEAIKTKVSVGDYINMISAYDGSLIAGVLAVIAVLATASHGFGAYVNFKLFPNGTKARIQNLLFLNSITTCVLFVAIVCSMLVCVFHSRHMKNNIHNGIVNGMNKYGQDKSAKVQIDALQIRFKCCGSKSFKEWFYITWLSPKFGGLVPTRTSVQSVVDVMVKSVSGVYCSGVGTSQVRLA